MGYRIDYQPIKKIRGMEKRISGTATWFGILLVLMVLLFHSIGPEVTYYVRRTLIPGDLSVTAAAVDHLAKELQNGETFSSALEVFCQMIIAGDSGVIG